MANNLVIHAFDRDPVPSPAQDRDLSGNPSPLLPHHKLIAYAVARDLLLAVRAAAIRDAKLRDEALRSAKSTALNCAEGAGRVSRADKARAFTIGARRSRPPRQWRSPPCAARRGRRRSGRWRGSPTAWWRC